MRTTSLNTNYAQVPNQQHVVDYRGGACTSNAIRYGLFTEFYRILSRTVGSVPLGANVLRLAAKTNYKLTRVTLHVFVHNLRPNFQEGH